MKIKCVRPLDGFTINKTHKVLGCVAEYVQLRGDNGEEYVVNESHFDLVKKRRIR